MLMRSKIKDLRTFSCRALLKFRCIYSRSWQTPVIVLCLSLCIYIIHQSATEWATGSNEAAVW